MSVTIPDKSYFRIGEVGRILGVEPYVIRFWESEFKSVRPIRSRSDQRLYRRRDVEELLTIKALLYEDMFTIAGAKKRLARMKRGESAPENTSGEILTDIKRELKEIKKIIS
ncbi:MAG: MerR family transcriptional regulator [Deltaproteobacteria bacterium]|nr:MerR family transcriptional regulator [Deltaproteobacteria bacterium]